jgi:hypothetical protein
MNLFGYAYVYDPTKPDYETFWSRNGMFDLRYCNLQKDLFHGLTPRTQYGESSIVSVSDLNSGNFLNGEDLCFDIIALRQAEAVQRWREITLSADKDFKDQVQKHWNVTPNDYASELCEYLGGIKSSIDINEVINTNITGDNSADIAGKATSGGRGKITFDSKGRYGVLMCIYHCLPIIDYTTSGIDPIISKVKASDYAIPEFDSIGMQQVPSEWLSVNNKVASSFNLGYAPRYIEYKTSVDRSLGGFKDNMRSWCLSYGDDELINYYTAQGTVNDSTSSSSNIESSGLYNYRSFKVCPSLVNNLFAFDADSSYDSDQLLCSTFFDVKATRNLSYDGMPY